MTKFDSFRKGGVKGIDPVVPGKPEESLIIDLITSKDDRERMPPKDSGDALPAAKIAIIEKWIKQGAKLDGDIKPDADLVRELRTRWNPPTPPAAYKFPVTVTALAFTNDGKRLVVGGHHELTVWDAAEGRLEKRIATRMERAYAMLFLPDGKLVVAGGRPGQEGDVRVYDIDGGTPKTENGVALLDGIKDKSVMIARLLEADDSVLCLAFHPESKKLAAGGCDRQVHVWDLSNGYANVQPEQSFENHADWVFGVAFTPDGKKLLTASRDKTAKVWDLAAKESVLTFPGHQNSVYGVAAQPDGKAGFSCGEDNSWRTWPTSGDGKQIRQGTGHGGPVFKVLYHPRQPLLATCSADKTVRLWDPAKGTATKTLSGHTDWVYAIAFSPDGELLASGSWNGEVKIWKVADGAVVKEFNASPGLQTAAAPK